MELTPQTSVSSIHVGLMREFEEHLTAPVQNFEHLYVLALRILQVMGHSEKRLLEENTRDKKKRITELAAEIKATTTNWKQTALGYGTAALQAGAGISGAFGLAPKVVKIIEGASLFGQTSSQTLNNLTQGNVGQKSTTINLRMQEMDTLSQKKAENTPGQTNQQLQEALKRIHEEKKGSLDR